MADAGLLSAPDKVEDVSLARVCVSVLCVLSLQANNVTVPMNKNAGNNFIYSVDFSSSYYPSIKEDASTSIFELFIRCASSKANSKMQMRVGPINVIKIPAG